MDSVDSLYQKLKKQQDDYVFSGIDVEIISKLVSYCPSNQERLFLFLGGPLLWLSTWNANKKLYKEKEISKLEQRIISLLSCYDCMFKNGYCILQRKEI